MRGSMPGAIETGFREARTRQILPQHESCRTSEIAFKRQGQQVVHQAIVNSLVLGQPERDLFVGLLHRGLHGNSDAPFDLSNVFEIRIKTLLVSRSEVPLEESELLCDGVEDAGALRPSAPTFFRVS